MLQGVRDPAQQNGSRPSRAHRRWASSTVTPIALVVLATVAWWVSVTAPMPMALPSFLLGWLVMMVAMMLPALVPVVTLYQRAARRGTVAPTAWFISGYLVVWTAAGIPAYVAWRQIQPAIMDGREWTGQLAGAALVLAAVYQLTPIKALCLRGCRSPLTSFTATTGSLADWRIAVRVGLRNGLWCLGCCWAFMTVLVAVGVMQPWWMAGIAAVIFAEKALPRGLSFVRPLALLMLVLGAVLIVDPHLIVTEATRRGGM